MAAVPKLGVCGLLAGLPGGALVGIGVGGWLLAGCVLPTGWSGVGGSLGGLVLYCKLAATRLPS